jgi:putative spermidine/putrescine transport system permease protein
VRVFLASIAAVTYALLFMPILLAIWGSVASSPVLVFPPQGFTLRWFETLPPEYLAALKVSLIVALGATFLATIVGTPAALALMRGQFIGRSFVHSLCLSPLMVPTLVTGVAMFQFALRLTDTLGIPFLGTIPGLIVAHSAFTLPFVVRATLAGQAASDVTLEEAAMGLGAGPFYTFTRVTLPLLSPGIVSGALFAFVTSMDDVPIALFVGGGDATTLPVKIFTAIQFSLGPELLAMATILIVISTGTMLILDRILGLENFLGLSRVQA